MEHTSIQSSGYVHVQQILCRFKEQNHTQEVVGGRDGMNITRQVQIKLLFLIKQCTNSIARMHSPHP